MALTSGDGGSDRSDPWGDKLPTHTCTRHRHTQCHAIPLRHFNPSLPRLLLPPARGKASDGGVSGRLGKKGRDEMANWLPAMWGIRGWGGAATYICTYIHGLFKEGDTYSSRLIERRVQNRPAGPTRRAARAWVNRGRQPDKNCIVLVLFGLLQSCKQVFGKKENEVLSSCAVISPLLCASQARHPKTHGDGGP